MKKKRIMVIGPSRSGKTTIVNKLNNYDGPLRRIPDLIYGENTIDVPSSYIEIPWMYKHVIAISQDASYVLVLIDQSNCEEVYSPGFAKAFKCPVIGVITKCDLAPQNKEKCKKQLKNIGVEEPYFHISFPLEEGFEELHNYLFRKVEV